jgi:hypothetical protein
MNYYELVQLADKIRNSISHLVDNDTVYENEYVLKKLREIMINTEFLKDKLLRLNINDVIIAAEEVEEND